MRLLKLEVTNHRCFRDGFVLDLSRPTLKKKYLGSGASWRDFVYPVAAIYGANASGKSAILSAVSYLQAAIAQSSGSWLDGATMVRDPFRLDSNSADAESSYAIDFIFETKVEASEAVGHGVHYHYEFTVNSEGIKHELMQCYISEKPTTLWERKAAKPKPRIVWGASKTPTGEMGGGFRFEVAPRELVLSRGLKMESPLQTTLARSLLAELAVLDNTSKDLDLRLGALLDALGSGGLSLDDFTDLVRAADTGIEDVLLDQEEAEINPEISRLLQRLIALASGGSEPTVTSEPVVVGEGEKIRGKAMRRALRFRHRSQEDDIPVVFSLGDESAGTLAWLGMIVPVIRALRNGSVLIVDELDASLHPALAELVVSLFQNPETNPYGAQLIFTSHDVSLLLPQSGAQLDRHQIWITEKDNSGSSELFSLGDFTDIKAKTNIAKQYLEGRYGGVPLLAPSLVSRLVRQPDGE